ncbi:uncharacterized protein LOC108672910 isoform X1 [Hyalella azteca]|uniref:Uncharacterized protein LOC108672910 isoform X1 n=1 Tax=Hyalella azteca TaxID=294128 RepID=A0A8B7NT05_HYAAZ|nr:uncharacterized protein LOC108672910 isoform X2 [Hyalella azteca]XP_018016157.1 uncharacterized protein LOC108672910 isoform X1 [Hyalella azteca]
MPPQFSRTIWIPKKSNPKALRSRTNVIQVALNGTPSQEVLAQLEQAKKENKEKASYTLDQLISRSSRFVAKFPCANVKVESIMHKLGVPGEVLEKHMLSVYPIIHHMCLNLLVDFLQYKKLHGSSIEKSLYASMDILAFVDRLLKRRPMSFLGANDRYLLPPPHRKRGSGGFEAVGTTREKHPLSLVNYLSYDEMKVSALLSMSSWSCFINNGRRKNYGALDARGTFEEEGVIVGQVGARLKRERVMEYADCVVTSSQNRPELGYGNTKSPHINYVWGKFWGGPLPTYRDANAVLQMQPHEHQSSPFEYAAFGGNSIFNITVYKKRIAITAEILLCEANSRAQACGKKAYVHVVGLGLGVWRAFEEQDELFIEAWGDALRNLNRLTHIAYVDFSYIGCSSMYGTLHNEKFPGSDVVIRFSKRNLHDKVPHGCILVCNYAWDGNSLPGNEFWMDKLCSTGDSAAACSSCIAELHNHHINPAVSGQALRVAVKEGRVITWAEYAKRESFRKYRESSDSGNSKSSSSSKDQNESSVTSISVKHHVSSKRSSVPEASAAAPPKKKIKIDRKSFSK